MSSEGLSPPDPLPVDSDAPGVSSDVSPGVSPDERLHHLDVIRGVAMLGILPVNLWFFAYPMAFGLDPDAHIEPGTANTLSLEVMRFGFQYKFITIFSFLFGTGMALLWQKAQDAGRKYGSMMVRRLLLLGVLGVLHAVFLWYGDIVAVYAGIGLVLCLFAGQRPRVLALIGGALLCIPLGMLGLLVLVALAGGGSMVAGANPSALDAAATAPWLEFISAAFQSLDHGSPGFETVVFRDGSFGRISVLRGIYWASSLLFAYALFYGWRVAGLMCLGMAALRHGWFADPRAQATAFRRLTLWGLVVGLPLHAAALWARGPSGSLGEALAEILMYFGSLGLSAAYVGLLALLVARFGRAWFLAPFAAVGRTAFSNYVLQSILANALFYSYGFALFGSLSPPELWLVAGGIWIVQLVVSSLWLIPFRTGPIEWVWRSLSSGRRLPLSA